MDRRFDRSRRVFIVTLHMVPLHDLRPTSVHRNILSAEMFVAWNVFGAYFVAAQMRRLALHTLYAFFSASSRQQPSAASVQPASVSTFKAETQVCNKSSQTLNILIRYLCSANALLV